MTSPARPSGEPIELRCGSTVATVIPMGAALHSLTVEGRALVDAWPIDEPLPYCRGQVLVPWPNRIRDGRFSFGGESHQLSLSEPERGVAIHGLVQWQPFVVTARSADSVTLDSVVHARPGYPWVLAVSVTYAAGVTGLDVTVSVRNDGDSPAPYGFGAHPYLRVGDVPIDELVLELGAETVLDVDERLLPVGRSAVAGTELDFRKAAPLAGRVVDHAFTDIQRRSDGRVWATVAAPDGRATSLWGDEQVTWWQVCTGDAAAPPWRRSGVAVEPMTCPPDAFNSNEDVVVLAPGEQHVIRWGIVAGTPST